eukprot:COSAG02_NODE_2225_length_9457_cov_5.020945_3_plen_93_part_00
MLSSMIKSCRARREVAPPSSTALSCHFVQALGNITVEHVRKVLDGTRAQGGWGARAGKADKQRIGAKSSPRGAWANRLKGKPHGKVLDDLMA